MSRWSELSFGGFRGLLVFILMLFGGLGLDEGLLGLRRGFLAVLLGEVFMVDAIVGRVCYNLRNYTMGTSSLLIS